MKIDLGPKINAQMFCQLFLIHTLRVSL